MRKNSPYTLSPLCRALPSRGLLSLGLFCLTLLKSAPVFALDLGARPIAGFPTDSLPVPKRPIRPADIYRLPVIADPQVSPDGKWISYTLTTIDSLKDSRNSDVWMVNADGTQDIQLTSSPDGESKARWSPDGKWLSFLSSRQAAEPLATVGNESLPVTMTKVEGAQVWLMDRRGGEGKRLTVIKGGIDDYAWSPDAKRLLLTITDAEPEDTGKVKTTRPYVIDRYQYKQDVDGYRYKKIHTHLYLFDIATKKLDTLTRGGDYDEEGAVWSPDGSQIAFVSNRTPDPDKNENSDIYVIEAKPGAAMRQLTTWKGTDNSPRWSPDGTLIAYTRSVSDEDYHMYDEPVLCVIPAAGGQPKLLSKDLDRPVFSPRWNKDGKTIEALVEDNMQQSVSAFPASGGKPEKLALLEGGVVNAFEISGDSRVVLYSTPQHPAELYTIHTYDEHEFVSSSTRTLTHHADSFLAPLKLADINVFQSQSADGAKVSGYYYRPADSPAGKKLPMVLFIHGGPVGQDNIGFDMTRQILAGAGYIVAAVNYRGSNGRGVAYSKTIFGDWGNKEVLDLHGAVDWLVKSGIADSARLGVAGWSYGGILTDYLIASDTRFKAASSGAGTGFTLSLYGVDQYINQYNNEIGPPWKAIDRYLRISYPLLKADRIKTPTLFMSGEKDFNVPTAGSEQMYQALRTLGVPTELIIYPGQFHGISIPSYQRDRLDRWLAWFKRYLG